MGSAEAKYLKINFDEILSKLREYAKSKAGIRKTRAIVLAGSLARGTYTGTSDADVLIIAEDLPKDVLERHALYAEANLPIDLQPRIYTTREFINMLSQRDHFAHECLALGIPLYGRQFFEDLKQSLRNQISS